MTIIEIIVLAVGVLIALSWMVSFRSTMNRGISVMPATINQTMLFFVSIILVLAFDWSPFHLLWMLPASFLIGMMSIAFPLSLLSIPGGLFARFCCIGLDPDKVRYRRRLIEKRIEKAREYEKQGVSRRDAIERVIKEEENMSLSDKLKGVLEDPWTPTSRKDDQGAE